MPGDKVIGRVAVKVLPDTSDFRKDAKRKLDALENSLEFVVPTKADMTGAQRDLIQGIREINARNRALDSRKIRIYTTVSTAGIDAEFTRALREMQSRADGRRLNINVDVVGALVDLQLDPAAKDRLAQELEDFRRDHSPLTIDVQLNLVQASTAATSARLSFLTRPRTVPILPYVQQGAAANVAATLAALSGARLLGTIIDDISQSLLRLDKNIPIIGTLALAIAGLSGYGLTAASNLAALAVALAQIAPAALVLPGIFAGLGISLGIFVTAMTEFTERVPEITSALQELEAAVGDNFWAGAQEPIRNFIDTLLPQFVAGVESTATQLGVFTGNLAASITGAFDGVLNQMFTDLAQSIEIAALATDAYAGIITTLGQVGASYLPRLAAWFADISIAFDQFLSAAAADGRLQIWIDTALVNLAALGNSLVSLAEIFGGIGAAATQAGGSSLTIFADTLERIATLVNSPAFQEQLTAVFTSAHTAMSRIGAISGPAVTQFFTELGQVLTNILPVVGNTIGSLLDGIATGLSQPELMSGIVLMFEGIQQGVAALTPAFAPLGAALGSLAQLVGTLAAAFGPVIAAAVIPLAQAFQTLVPALQPIITLLAGTLTQALVAITPLFNVFVQAIAGLLTGGILPALQSIFAGLLPIITVLGQQLGTVLGPVFANLTPVVALLGQVIGQVLVAVLPIVAQWIGYLGQVLVPLSAAFAQLAAEFLPKLGAALVQLITAVQPLFAVIMQVVGAIVPVLIPVLQFLAGLLLGAVVGAIRGVAQVFEGLIGMFQAGVAVWKALFAGDLPGAISALKDAFSSFGTFIAGLWNIIWNVTILKGAKLAFGLLKSLFTASWTGLRAIFTEAGTALLAYFRTFLAALARSPQNALNAMKTLFSQAWTTIRTAASSAFQLLLAAVRAHFGTLFDLVRGLPGRIKSALGNLGSLLTGAGGDLINGFIRGFTGKVGEAIGKIRDAASRIAQAARDALKIKSPSRVFMAIGSFTAEGFEVGFVDQIKGAIRRVDKLMSEFSGIEIKPISVSSDLTDRSRQALANLTAESVGAVFKQFIYNAAPNNSIDSEEDLFDAMSRGRADW